MPRTDAPLAGDARPARMTAGDPHGDFSGHHAVCEEEEEVGKKSMETTGTHAHRTTRATRNTRDTRDTRATRTSPPVARLRPGWSRRSSRAGVAGYLFVRAGDAVCRALVRDLEAREAAHSGCHPVGLIDVAWLRPGVEEGTAATVPALAVYRDGREIARAIGASAVLGFIDALFAQAEAEAERG